MLRVIRRATAVFAATVLLGAPAMAQENEGEPKPRLIGDIASRLSPDHYPPSAQRAGEHGRVRTRLAVDARGIVTECTVVESVSLDAATCAGIQDGTRMFDPARDKRGKAIASHYDFNVRWSLPESVPDGASIMPPTPSASRFDVTVETDSSVSHCEAVALPSGIIPPDDRMRVCQALARGLALGVTQRNGGIPRRFRILMTKDTTFGDAPPLSGEWPQDMQKVQVWQSDFDLDAQGYATNCMIDQQVGSVDVQNVMTRCRERRRYQTGSAPIPKGHDIQRLGYIVLSPAK